MNIFANWIFYATTQFSYNRGLRTGTGRHFQLVLFSLATASVSVPRRSREVMFSAEVWSAGKSQTCTQCQSYWSSSRWRPAVIPAGISSGWSRISCNIGQRSGLRLTGSGPGRLSPIRNPLFLSKGILLTHRPPYLLSVVLLLDVRINLY